LRNVMADLPAIRRRHNEKTLSQKRMGSNLN
jgi:hypothetical protein